MYHSTVHIGTEMYAPGLLLIFASASIAQVIENAVPPAIIQAVDGDQQLNTKTIAARSINRKKRAGVPDMATIMEKFAKRAAQMMNRTETHTRKKRSFGCTAPTGLTDQIRTMFLNAHNDGRRAIAKGEESNKCGQLPGASNMYEVEWDCDLEEELMNQLGCSFSFGSFSGETGQSMGMMGGAGDGIDLAAYLINGWWAEARTQGLPADLIYPGSAGNAYNRFAQMAHSKTTKIACGFKECPSNQVYVSCVYNKIAYYTNTPIYTAGTACAADADCTVHPSSTCNDGLCVAGEAPPATNADCGDNPSMTDQARDIFLNVHNELRSSLANGNEPDAAGGNAPKAKQMLKMVYDCDVEANAQAWSDLCVYQHSTSAERPGLGENLYMTTLATQPLDTAADASSRLWWQELADYGVGQDNILTPAVWNKDPPGQIGHYTQMAWETTYRLGCGITHCPTMTFVTCQYGPAGNMMNDMIYTKGDPCTDDNGCPGAQTCSVAEGLCVMP